MSVSSTFERRQERLVMEVDGMVVVVSLEVAAHLGVGDVGAALACQRMI